MKCPALLLAAILFAPLHLSAQSIQKTLVKAFNLDQIHQVDFQLPGEVEVSHWHQPYLRIELSIELGTSNEGVFKRLLTSGRYNLLGVVEDGKMTIKAPSIGRVLYFSDGTSLQEKITYKVYLPSTVELELGELARKSR